MDKSKWSWNAAEWIIPFLALCVTVDQWVASSGSADPYQIFIAGKSFSVMAAARGVSIVLTVTYTLYKIRTLRANPQSPDRILFWILVGCIVLLLATEALVITPYTMTVMSTTDIGRTLMSLSPIFFYVWALFVSDAALLAVITAGLSSLVIENAPTQVKQAVKSAIAKPIAPKTVPETVQPETAKSPKLETLPERLKRERGEP